MVSDVIQSRVLSIGLALLLVVSGPFLLALSWVPTPDASPTAPLSPDDEDDATAHEIQLQDVLPAARRPDARPAPAIAPFSSPTAHGGAATAAAAVTPAPFRAAHNPPLHC